MNDVAKRKKAYWFYQYRLGKEYLIPLLEQWNVDLDGKRVLDIGCAECGILCSMVEKGAKGIGVEISPSRLQFAREFAGPNRLSRMHLVAGDIFHFPLRHCQKPDIILLRDVFEHLPDKDFVLSSLSALMDKDSKLFITFPPFYAPFGGHQQLLKSFLGKVPYFHILPNPIWNVFRWWIKNYDANPATLKEMFVLRSSRSTIGRFKKLAIKHGLHISHSCFYISRPSYKLRFGWPVIRSDFWGNIPILREFIVSGAFFLLEKKINE